MSGGAVSGAGLVGRGSVTGLPVLDRCMVMGIVNVTPDSFSDGGSYLECSRAVEHALALVADGADIVDVGGESTRPGAHRVPADEELRRVVPVIRELAGAGARISIDTTRASVAAAALEAGATVVNDTSGGLADPAMVSCVAAAGAGVPYIAMHWRAPSAEMARHAHYDDVVTDVTNELGRRLDALVDGGVAAERIILDPGLGFAKRPPHDWALLAGMASLRSLGRPILVGASRKSFLGALLTTEAGTPPPAGREAATAAVSALAAFAGAYCVRVHEVADTLDAVRVAEAWRTEVQRTESWRTGAAPQAGVAPEP